MNNNDRLFRSERKKGFLLYMLHNLGQATWSDASSSTLTCSSVLLANGTISDNCISLSTDRSIYTTDDHAAICIVCGLLHIDDVVDHSTLSAIPPPEPSPWPSIEREQDRLAVMESQKPIAIRSSATWMEAIRAFWKTVIQRRRVITRPIRRRFLSQKH